MDSPPESPPHSHPESPPESPPQPPPLVDFSTLPLDTFSSFPMMVMPDHPQHSYFRCCLRARNPHAIYLQSMRLAFNLPLLDVALEKLRVIKDNIPIAKLLYLLLGYCAGFSDTEAYTYLWAEVGCAGMEEMGIELKRQIESLNPRRQNTYASTFKCEDFPHVPDEDCTHPDDKYCIECIFYRLGLEICALT